MALYEILEDGTPRKVAGGGGKNEHPIGSYHICKTGSEDPAIKFGGTWTQIATNVVLPLGSFAPVSTSTTLNTLKSTTPLEFRMANGNDTQLPSGANFIGANYNHMQVQQANAGNNKGAIYPVNLWADLSRANNKLGGVDIWLREA